MDDKVYRSYYTSPIGEISLTSNRRALIGLSFDESDHGQNDDDDNEIIRLTKEWLDIYFKGKRPDFIPKTELDVTPFQKEVYDKTIKIEYGKTKSYKEIAQEMQSIHDKKISCQAIGQALKRNPILIIIPCHRIIKASGDISDYAGGIERKKFLLHIEGIDNI